MFKRLCSIELSLRASDRKTYQLSVFEYPTMVRADAKLEYPSYTKLESKTIADTRRVSAAVGTKLTWQIYLNKPVASAELVEIEVPEAEGGNDCSSCFEGASGVG